MIRLAAFDLDGTLMGADQQIRPRVQEAVRQALARGVIVTLATGRMFSGAAPFAQQLNITAPLICYQGGWIQALGGEVLHRVTLPTPVAAAAVQLADARGWHTVLYADGRLYIQSWAYPVSFYAGLLGEDIIVNVPWEEILARHTVDKVLFVAEPEHIPAMTLVLNQQFAPQSEVVQSHKFFVEIVPQGVNKGRALEWLARHLGIPQEETLSAGDQQNDLSMVQWAGVGVAMGNAIPEVLHAANWVAPPVTEDGAAVLLEKFVLHEVAG
ncbi:MAG TPA: Cof-type HAD-IIB family hydrolase [Anaerolineae bacterium]|nr:Cof-type HAD-IIB family hydrolase [Anaerolineae bacterium]